MVYLAIKGSKIIYCTDKEELKKNGITKPDVEMTEDAFKSAGGFARIIDGKIVVGDTPEESAEKEKQKKINEYQAQLDNVDNEAKAGRAVRELVIALAEKAGLDGMDAYKNLRGHEAKAEEIRLKQKPLI